MTMSLLIKPYETIRFPSFTTIIIPSVVFTIHLLELFELFHSSSSQNGFIIFIMEICLFIQGRASIYLLCFIIFFLVKSYVLFYLMDKEKVDDLEQIEEEQRKIIEERRRMIEEKLKKHEERQAVIIHSKEDHSGGLQGFDGIKLFEDISW